MKRFIQFLSATVVSVGLAAGVAAAAPVNCTISNTGQNSVNTCTNKNTDVVTVDCDNNVNVLNINGQIATSGNGTGDNNTTGGTVTTGSAVNYNGSTVTLGASCGPAATVATAAQTTPAGGQGAVAAAPAPAPAAPKVASLPHTGSNSVLDATAIGVGTVGAAMAVSRLGVSAYRRFALK